MLDAGKLNKRIEIQTNSAVQDSFGDPIPVWTTAATRWANISPIQGRELEIAKQTVGEVSHKITLRYYSGLLPRMQFKLGSRVFSIESVVDTDEAHVEHICLCTEVVN